MTGSADDLPRDNAIHRLKAKQAFKYSAFSYVAVNIFLWVIWAITKGHDTDFPPWPLWVTVGWGFGLAFQAWNAYGSMQITEDDIRKEMDKGS